MMDLGMHGSLFDLLEEQKGVIFLNRNAFVVYGVHMLGAPPKNGTAFFWDDVYVHYEV